MRSVIGKYLYFKAGDFHFITVIIIIKIIIIIIIIKLK